MDPSYWLSTTSPEALGAYGSVGAQYGPGAPGTIGYDQGVAQAGSNATSPWQPTDAGVTNALKFMQGIQAPTVPTPQRVATPAAPRPAHAPSVGINQLLSMLGAMQVTPAELASQSLARTYKRA